MVDISENAETNTVSVPKIVLLYGFITTASLIVFFLLMKLLGFERMINLRYINSLIFFAFSYVAVKKIKVERPRFLLDMGIIMFIGMISYIAFGVFMFLYLAYLDTGFMEYLKGHAPFGSYLTPLTTSISVTSEGIAIAIVYSLIYGYWKRSRQIGDYTKIDHD